MSDIDNLREKDISNLLNDEISRLSSIRLDDILDQYIASNGGIEITDINFEYIMQRRINNIYPTIKYNIDSLYGGYSTLGLAIYSKVELDRIEENAETILFDLSKK